MLKLWMRYDLHFLLMKTSPWKQSTISITQSHVSAKLCAFILLCRLGSHASHHQKAELYLEYTYLKAQLSMFHSIRCLILKTTSKIATSMCLRGGWVMQSTKTTREMRCSRSALGPEVVWGESKSLSKYDWMKFWWISER